MNPWSPGVPARSHGTPNLRKMPAAKIYRATKPFPRPESRIGELRSPIPEPSMALPKGPVRDKRDFRHCWGGRLNHTLRTIRGKTEAADQILGADQASPQWAPAGESTQLRLSFCCLLQKSVELSKLLARQ